MKFRFLLLALFLSVFCYGQDFANRPDYITGYGVAKTEAAADSLAMISLARAIYTDVISETTSKYYDDGKKKRQSYFNNVSLSTRIRIIGAEKQVNRLKRGMYEVYRYFNKQEYINARIMICMEKMCEAERLMAAEDSVKNYRSNNPHNVNLVLGSLYTAYVSVNDSLLNFLYPKSVNLKETLKTEIKTVYERAKSIQIWDGKEHGTMAYERNHYPLPGFEYRKSNEWVAPTVFKTIETQEVTRDDTKKRWAHVEGIVNNTAYHILYEELVDGKYMKIPVPDLFYF